MSLILRGPSFAVLSMIAFGVKGLQLFAQVINNAVAPEVPLLHEKYHAANFALQPFLAGRSTLISHYRIDIHVIAQVLQRILA